MKRSILFLAANVAVTSVVLFGILSILGIYQRTMAEVKASGSLEAINQMQVLMQQGKPIQFTADGKQTLICEASCREAAK